MKFITKHFEKIIIVLLLLVMLQQCNTSSRISKLEKNEKIVSQKFDSLHTVKIQKLIEIEGLKISKRTLYDWNSIVRTSVRPDDRMNQYDLEIQTLEKTK